MNIRTMTAVFMLVVARHYTAHNTPKLFLHFVLNKLLFYVYYFCHCVVDEV